MEPSGPGPVTPPPRPDPAATEADDGAKPPVRFAPPAVRFAWWDAVVVFLAGQLVGATVGFAVGYSITGDEVGDAGAFTTACGFLGQFAAYLVTVWAFSRWRGTGSLRHDLGFTVHWRDWWAVPLGTACAIGLGLLVLPLRELVDQNQAVVDDLLDASGAELAVFAVAAGVLAPIFEELVFRGLLQRALRVRMSANWAIAISALAFGCVHFLGGNFLGTLAVLPALVALGAISGLLAERSGDLSQSILLHMGFNLLAVAGAIAS
jgi:membrane protease YdiL (CAAX protease family)